MLKNLLGKSKKQICFVRLSSRIKPFKYLSAPIKIGIDESKLPAPTKLDKATIEYLERVSLVGFESEKAVKVVEEAIRFADQIFEVDTTNVRPMVTVLENASLHLREDIAKNDVTRSELLSHSEKCIENYYVAPRLNTQDSKELAKEKKICQN